jgi:hypothetical protein
MANVKAEAIASLGNLDKNSSDANSAASLTRASDESSSVYRVLGLFSFVWWAGIVFFFLNVRFTPCWSCLPIVQENELFCISPLLVTISFIFKELVIK